MDPILVANHVTRDFAGTRVLSDVNFRIGPGECVALLGPNGAGKTTLLRILAGLLPTTGGRVEVAGAESLREAAGIRRRVGYLAERAPMYGDMRVKEFLAFRAKLKGLPRRVRRERIREVVDRCGLGGVRRDLIGRLSRGFRQRVGLADALLAHPPVLLLDEPAMGVDPLQNRELRDWLRSLTPRHTIVLATHQLAEAEQICSRVLLLHRGRLMADERVSTLREASHEAGSVEVEVRGPRADVLEAFAHMPGVAEVEADDGRDWLCLRLLPDGDFDLSERAAGLCAREGWALRRLNRLPGSLEGVMMRVARGSRLS